MVKVLGITASDIISYGLGEIISRVDDITYLGSTKSFLEYKELICLQVPDVVIIDIQSIDKPKAVELKHLVEGFTGLSPSVGFIAITDWPNKSRFDYCQQLGIKGYCLKTVGQADLLAALRAIATGKPYIEGNYAKKISGGIQASGTLKSLLSKRHLEILNLLLQGLTNDEIADRLFISLSTVKSHINVILKKLDARDRAQVIARLAQDMIDDAVNQRSYLN